MTTYTAPEIIAYHFCADVAEVKDMIIGTLIETISWVVIFATPLALWIMTPAGMH